MSEKCAFVRVAIKPLGFPLVLRVNDEVYDDGDEIDVVVGPLYDGDTITVEKGEVE